MDGGLNPHACRKMADVRGGGVDEGQEGQRRRHGPVGHPPTSKRRPWMVGSERGSFLSVHLPIHPVDPSIHRSIDTHTSGSGSLNCTRVPSVKTAKKASDTARLPRSITDMADGLGAVSVRAVWRGLVWVEVGREHGYVEGAQRTQQRLPFTNRSPNLPSFDESDIDGLGHSSRHHCAGTDMHTLEMRIQHARMRRMPGYFFSKRRRRGGAEEQATRPRRRDDAHAHA